MPRIPAALALLCAYAPLRAEATPPFDAAVAFGARPSVSDMTLSPDGQSVAYIAPMDGQGAAVYTLSLARGAAPRMALRASGKPDRVAYGSWVSNDRLVCTVYAILKDPTVGFLPYSRVVAVNADGTDSKLLSKRDSFHAHGLQLGGGQVIDWLPGEDGAVLMTRVYVPNDQIGTRFGSTSNGLGVDRIDTRTLATKRVEAPRTDASEYVTDGRGTIRIVGLTPGTGKAMYQANGILEFMYRMPGSQDWHKLSDFDSVERTGFDPVAVDPEQNVAYGFEKKDGRIAVYTVALDGSLREQLVYTNPDVDVDQLIEIGRQRRVVGVSYATDARKAVYFPPEIQSLLASLSKALPQEPILHVVGSSLDGNRLLIFAGSDSDPGLYYIFDHRTHQLQTFLVVRGALEGVKLTSVRSVSYPAADGVMVPAYLTLPPGTTSPEGLPAIVLPHGGPSARDVWGFDWLSQFFAARGFAVLQPNFRGSLGYGDAWFEKNGFRSWEVAIGDVVAGGRWLVGQRIADPARLGIVGWSYGGYAALQSAVVDPAVFKAVVAIAAVTDLAALKEQYRHWSSYELVSKMVGDGPHVRAGSPIEHADRIKVPVLMFHGGFDRNVSIGQSQRMCARLTAAGGNCELVTWDDLDHYLEDSSARALMLRRSDEFLRKAFGMK